MWVIMVIIALVLTVYWYMQPGSVLDTALDDLPL